MSCLISRSTRPNDADSRRKAADLELALQCELRGRVSGLRVEQAGAAVQLHGRAVSFHAVQLALAALRRRLCSDAEIVNRMRVAPASSESPDDRLPDA